MTNFKNYTSLEKSLTDDSSYEMKFSDHQEDNDSREPNRSNGSGNGKNNGGNNRRGYIPVVIFAVAFIVILVLMLYFFVFRSNSTTYTLSDAAFTYSVDTDHDGNPDVDENGYPDFSGWDRTNGSFTIGDTQTTNSIIMEGGTSAGETMAAGSVVSILVNNVQTTTPYINVVKSYYADSNTYYSITGTFQTIVNNRSVTYSYTAIINQLTYEHYLVPILTNTMYQDSDGAYQYYYSSSKTYNYKQEVPSNASSWIVTVVIGVFSIAILIYVANRMFKGAGGSGAGAMSGFIDNVARKQTNSKVRFADVAGCDEAKAELVEMVDYFHATDKYTRLGAKLPHGVILVGPPGTGKTLLAKAVAGEANVPFYSISGSDFVEMYVGVGASRVRSLFKTAKQNAPCLVFIDEIDAVGRQRGAGLGGGNDEREQTLNQLLVEMDGFEDNSGIIVMAATNRSDVLDPALTRPGRFDRNITVDLPDRKGRAAILKVHSRNKKLASDLSFDAIASRTVGFSGADLANIMNEAAILAVRANRSVITTMDIDEAIDRAISGPAKKSHLEVNERKQVAYHEAGHAVIGIFLPFSDKVQKITIVPRGRTGGHVLMTPEQDHFLLTKNQLMARITGYLGGRTSEEIFFGDVSTGASNDIEVATRIARSMVTEYGMSDLGLIQYEKPGGSVFLGRDYNSMQSNYSTQIAYEIDKAVRKIVDECHEQATKLLTEHREDVELIAKTLIENETITADQIDYLLKNKKLPEEDLHVMALKNGLTPKNAKNIFLYPGYESFYVSVDHILENNPSRLVIVVPGGQAINDESFRKACTRNASDPSRIGILTINAKQAQTISLSIETFASHLEDYSGVPVLLVKTNDLSLSHIEETYTAKAEKPKDEKAPETPVASIDLPEEKEAGEAPKTETKDESNSKDGE